MKEHILIPDEQNPNQQHNLHIVMDGQVEVSVLLAPPNCERINFLAFSSVPMSVNSFLCKRLFVSPFQVQYTSQHDLGTVHHVQTAGTIVPEDIQITTAGNAVVVPHPETNTITYHPEPATIKTDGGPIQIVQIRLPEDSEEQKQWINLLQAQHQA